MLKKGSGGESIYPNQFFTGSTGDNGTKHVFVGATRLVSKLVKQPKPVGNAGAGGGSVEEKDLFFFHPDHLGSSHYVTDTQGKIFEHMEYFPFGETWVQEASNTKNTPFLFTDKEFDQETGLYYFGARYYDPRTSVWQSTYPILGKYLPFGGTDHNQHLPSMGGVFNPVNLGVYTYAGADPLKYLDPDGKELIIQGSTTYKTQVLSIVQKLTNDKLAFAKDGQTVIIQTSGSGSKQTGSTLVRNLVNQSKTTTVHDKSGETQAAPVPRSAKGFADATAKGEATYVPGVVGTGIGTDAEVGFDLSVTRSLKGQAVPKEIVLGHELIHAEHIMGGTIAGKGTGTVPGPEEQAVGLGAFKGGITENSLRKEQGLSPRTEY